MTRQVLTLSDFFSSALSPSVHLTHREKGSKAGWDCGQWGAPAGGSALNGKPQAMSPVCPPKVPTEKQGTSVSETKNWSSDVACEKAGFCLYSVLFEFFAIF